MFDYLLECSGTGAKIFLQGQLTCNVNELQINQPQLTACCNLQGRVIFTVYVIKKSEQQFLLQIPTSMKDIIVTHLDKYARFSKCAIEDVGAKNFSPLPITDNKTLILNRIPVIYPETSEKIIALRLNLHLIDGAISFKKGCYLGQEIIARLHFKSQLKHHLVLGKVLKSTSLKYGDDILDDQKNKTGTLVDFYLEKNSDTIFVLFVDSLENKHPQLETGEEITLC